MTLQLYTADSYDVSVVACSHCDGFDGLTGYESEHDSKCRALLFDYRVQFTRNGSEYVARGKMSALRGVADVVRRWCDANKIPQQCVTLWHCATSD